MLPNFELRWLVEAGTSTKPKRLEYRVAVHTAISGIAIWSEWQPVPIVVREESDRTEMEHSK